MIRRTIAGAAGLLVLFHAWLLGSQLWDGQLAEPGLVVRWLIAAALVGALAALRRSGASMFWGRKAVSIWLLAALLHGPAMAEDRAGFASPALPEAMTAVLQIAAASVVLGLGLALLAAAAARLFAVSCGHIDRELVVAHGPRASHHVARFAPRPPPLRA